MTYYYKYDFVDYGHCEHLNASQCLKKHFRFSDFITGKEPFNGKYNKIHSNFNSRESFCLRICNKYLSLLIEEKKIKKANSYASSFFLEDVLFDIYIEVLGLEKEKVFKYPYDRRDDLKNISSLRICFVVQNKPNVFLWLPISYCIDILENNNDYSFKVQIIDGIIEWINNYCRTKFAKTKHEKLIQLARRCLNRNDFDETFSEFSIELLKAVSNYKKKELRPMRRIS